MTKPNSQTAVLPPADLLQSILNESAARHRHLCPRQVLGARLGLAGLRALGLVDDDYGPRFDNGRKRLLTIVETDGCGADGIAVATDCYVGRRTLRVLDYGKVAAVLVDTKTETAVRVHPSPKSRHLAARYAPEAQNRWESYLLGYQRIPDADLIVVTPVRLTQPLAAILSRPNRRAICAHCGEEIINERELIVENKILCQTCASGRYYEATGAEATH